MMVNMIFENHKQLKIFCPNKKFVKTLIRNYELGKSFYEKIDGNVSFLICDTESRKIIAVRDFFGFYPLYYTTVAGEFHFSDSVKDLIRFWQEKTNQLPNINHNRLVDYFNPQKFLTVINEETFFEGIYRILPAHIMIVEENKDIVYKPYKKIDLDKYKKLSDTAYIEKFRELFVASVRQNTEGCRHIAAHVSGGLDSSSVACVAQSLTEEPILTLHINPGIDAANEQHYAELIPKKWHTNHQNLSSSTNFYESMEQAIHLSALPESTNLPMAFFSPMAEACREAGTEILLSGHCGDQVVGYGIDYLKELCAQRKWQELDLSLKQWLKDDTKVKKYAAQLLLISLKNERSDKAVRRAARVLVRHFSVCRKEVFELLQEQKKHKEIITRVNLLQNKFKDSSIITKELVVSDLVKTTLTPQQENHLKSFYETLGVEHFELSYQFYVNNESFPNNIRICFPFLDQELVSLSLNVSNKLRFGEGKLRGILRQAMSDYLPKEIAERTTKAVFRDYALLAFNSMYEAFKQKNPVNYDAHPVWESIDRQAFDNLAKNIQTNSNLSFGLIIKATRVIYFAIWLDYLKTYKTAN